MDNRQPEVGDLLEVLQEVLEQANRTQIPENKGRELALVKTKIEEALLWASKLENK